METLSVIHIILLANIERKMRLLLLCFAFVAVVNCHGQNASVVLRRKRLTEAIGWKAWPDAIIPYCYDSALPAWKDPIYKSAMAAFSRRSCISFQYYDNCAAISGGGFKCKPGGAPWSYIGRRWSVKDVVLGTDWVSVCHELFHIIGGHHEQNNYKSLGIANMMIGNVQAWYQKSFVFQFSEKDDIHDNKIITSYFDLGSPTLYTPYGTSSTGYPEYDVMYTDLYVADKKRVFLDQISRDINEFYDCWSKYDCGTKPTCYNEGYPGVYDQQCGCVCPAGLESSSNCNSVKTKPTGSWPDTDMKILMTKDGCPSGLTESTVVVHNVVEAFSEMRSGLTTTLYYDYDVDSETTTLHFCSKPSAGNTEVWEHGVNGFLAENGICPSGFKQGSAKMFYDNGNVDVNLEFCVQNGIQTEPIKGLPTDKSFAVFITGERPHCQEIDGFVPSLGYLDIFHSNAMNISGDTPHATYTNDFDGPLLTLYFCSYAPLTYSGTVIELTSSNPTAVITSPNYPGIYTVNIESNWIINVEEGARIRAEFVSFDVDRYDSFTYRRYILNSVPTRLTNENVLPQHNIVSVYNRLAFQLRTGVGGYLGVSATGFNITLTRLGAEDYCYSVADKGESYDGDWNYAIDGTKCLPWNQRFDNNVTYSGYDDFAGTTSTLLTGSACRNPQGRLHKPACLTRVKEGNFTLRYCDVCHIEYGIRDVIENCANAIAEDASICTGVTGGKCLKTCTELGHLPSVTIPPKVGDVTCPSPSIPFGASQTSASQKSVYHPGDVIEIECTGSSTKIVQLTCLSSGNWPKWEDLCYGCAAGWAEHSGKCYKMIGRVENWYRAKTYCDVEFNAYLMSPKTTSEHDFFLDWRTYVGVNEQWWMGGQYINGAFRWYVDNTAMDMSLFGSPSDSNGGKKCVVHNTASKWKSNGCDWAPNKHNFICEKPLEGPPMTCTDRKQECSTMLNENPRACADPVMKTNTCPYTCGADMCDTTGSECSNLPTLANGNMVVVKSSLKPGETVEYTCNSGYERQGGSLVRACKRDGSLTGSPPVCTLAANAITPVGDFPMGSYRYTTHAYTAYTGESKQFEITRDGTIHSWQLYCECDDLVHMEVWRLQSGTSYKLVGYNEIQCFAGIARDVAVDVADRISVQAGDRLGIFDMEGGCFTYYSCSSSVIPMFSHVHTNTDAFEYSDMTHISQQYTFSGDSCMMFAINAQLGP